MSFLHVYTEIYSRKKSQLTTRQQHLQVAEMHDARRRAHNPTVGGFCLFPGEKKKEAFLKSCVGSVCFAAPCFPAGGSVQAERSQGAGGRAEEAGSRTKCASEDQTTGGRFRPAGNHHLHAGGRVPQASVFTSAAPNVPQVSGPVASPAPRFFSSHCQSLSFPSLDEREMMQQTETLSFFFWQRQFSGR